LAAGLRFSSFYIVVLSKAGQSATNIVEPLRPFELLKEFKLDAKSRSMSGEMGF